MSAHAKPRKEITKHMRDIITTTNRPRPLRLPALLSWGQCVDIANTSESMRTTHDIFIGHRQAQVVTHGAIARVRLAVQGSFTFIQPRKPGVARIMRHVPTLRHAPHVTGRNDARDVTPRDNKLSKLLTKSWKLGPMPSDLHHHPRRTVCVLGPLRPHTQEVTMTASKTPSKAELVDLLAKTTAALEAATAGQHATPAAVVEATASPVAPAVPVPSASDNLKAFTEARGLRFSKGGRTVWNTDTLQAAVQVLKTGEPQVIPIKGLANLGARGVTHVAIGRNDDGKSVFSQYVYTPDAS